MKIAFLVQAHTNQQQVELLADALTSPHSDVFVHYDAKSQLREPTDLRLIPRISVYHGGYSQVQCTLDMLHIARATGQYDYYFFLSGQCFPIKPLGWLMDRLCPKLDYINYYPMPRDAFAKRLDRLEHFHFERHSERRSHAWLNRLARKLPKRNFVKGLSLWPYAGSNWWCLRASTIDYVLDYVRRNPRFVSYLRYTSYCDEVFFQSIISNMAIESELKPALFCADFDPTTGRPKVYTVDDIDLLTASDVFVARKMDLRIDARVIEHFAQLVPFRSRPEGWSV